MQNSFSGLDASHLLLGWVSKGFIYLFQKTLKWEWLIYRFNIKIIKWNPHRDMLDKIFEQMNIISWLILKKGEVYSKILHSD